MYIHYKEREGLTIPQRVHVSGLRVRRCRDTPPHAHVLYIYAQAEGEREEKEEVVMVVVGGTSTSLCMSMRVLITCCRASFVRSLRRVAADALCMRCVVRVFLCQKEEEEEENSPEVFLPPLVNPPQMYERLVCDRKFVSLSSFSRRLVFFCPNRLGSASSDILAPS